MNYNKFDKNIQYGTKIWQNEMVRNSISCLLKPVTDLVLPCSANLRQGWTFIVAKSWQPLQRKKMTSASISNLVMKSMRRSGLKHWSMKKTKSLSTTLFRRCVTRLMEDWLKLLSLDLLKIWTQLLQLSFTVHRSLMLMSSSKCASKLAVYSSQSSWRNVIRTMICSTQW